MNRTAVALTCLIAVTHYGYILAPLEHQPTVFYILRGAEGTALFLLIARICRRHWPIFAACLFGAFEEGQTALCGAFSGPEASENGICLDITGPVPYAALAAAGFVYLIRTRLWKTSPKP